MLDLIGRALPETPLIPKFNIRLLPAMAVKIAEFPQCDAITVSNTIPWGAYPERIPWEAYFGSSVSPLEGLGGPGGGGLSGAPLLPFLIEWLNEAVHLKIGKPIIACGGILSPRDVRRVLSHGASAIQVGSASILRPWRVQPIIDEANRRIR